MPNSQILKPIYEVHLGAGSGYCNLIRKYRYTFELALLNDTARDISSFDQVIFFFCDRRTEICPSVKILDKISLTLPFTFFTRD